MAIDHKLRVCVVGSGLAGLATARILREYHDVTVFERGDTDNATGGQGIAFFPSGVKALKTMGYDPSRARPVRVGAIRHFDKLGNGKGDVPLDYDKQFGTDPWTGLRSDCRDELYRLATAPADELKISNFGSVKINFNTAVKDVDPENAIVTLQDGSKFEADLVIIADGIHSRLRKTVLGNDQHVAKKMGLTIYRVAVPIEEAKKVLDPLPDWIQPDAHGKGCITYFQSLDDTNRLIVTYNLRDFEYIHVSIHLPTGEGHGTEVESWHKDANRSDILDAFSDFDPRLLKLVRVGTQVKVWDMQDMDPLPFWNKGHTILIGDAAHAMTPMQGQGANMATEDAEAFRLFPRGCTREDVPVILAQIDRVRRPRTAYVLETTRQTLPNTKLEDRMARMKYNNSYNGIFDALKQNGGK